MADARLARLRHVADMMRDKALSELRAARLTEARIEQQLDGTKPQPADLAEWHGDPRRALAYNQWCDARRRLLNGELARARALAETRLHAAAQAVGRQSVLDRLDDRMRASTRKQEWSPPSGSDNA